MYPSWDTLYFYLGKKEYSSLEGPRVLVRLAGAAPPSWERWRSFLLKFSTVTFTHTFFTKSFLLFYSWRKGERGGKNTRTSFAAEGRTRTPLIASYHDRAKTEVLEKRRCHFPLWLR